MLVFMTWHRAPVRFFPAPSQVVMLRLCPRSDRSPIALESFWDGVLNFHIYRIGFFTLALLSPRRSQEPSEVS